MKKLWIFVVVLWLVLLPLTWWDSQNRIVTTLSSGITVNTPKSSQAALRDLEAMLQQEQGITYLYIKYGLVRSSYVIYPGTAVLTLTAPWSWEKLRYPKLRSLSQNLKNKRFIPVEFMSNASIDAVQVWVSFEGDKCIVDNLLFIKNNTDKPIDELILNLPVRDWLVRSQSGELLDHATTNDYLLKVFLPTVIPPNAFSQLLLTLESEVKSNAALKWAEAVIIQPVGITVGVNLTRVSSLQYFELSGITAGYWLLLLPAS